MKKLLILITSFVLAISCDSKQAEKTKPLSEETSEMMNNLFTLDDPKPTGEIKIIGDRINYQESKTFKTAAFPCRLVPYPNAPNPILRITKGVSLEIVGSRVEGKFTWYKTNYLGKTGWVRGSFLK